MHALKNLAVAAAMVGLVASAQAEYYPGSTDFEGDAPLADGCWSNVVEAADAADLCKTADDVDTFYALSSGAPMTSVAFTGAGCVDDIILSDTDSPLSVYTLTWGEGFDSVSFTTNGVAGAALVAADGAYQFQAPEGLEVVLTGNTGYRTIEVSATGSSSAISLEGVSGIAKYFPQTATADQDGSAEQEILAALGWPRAETWRVGVENDATTELSADTAPERGLFVYFVVHSPRRRTVLVRDGCHKRGTRLT